MVARIRLRIRKLDDDIRTSIRSQTDVENNGKQVSDQNNYLSDTETEIAAKSMYLQRRMICQQTSVRRNQSITRL